MGVVQFAYFLLVCLKKIFYAISSNSIVVPIFHNLAKILEVMSKGDDSSGESFNYAIV